MIAPLGLLLFEILESIILRLQLDMCITLNSELKLSRMMEFNIVISAAFNSNPAPVER